MAMTVKHEKSDGSSKVYEVSELEYHPGNPPKVALDGKYELTSGRVFVMNSAGATVAKYVLG